MESAVRASVKNAVFFTLLAVVLPNVFYVLGAAWLELGRPYVSLDYLLAATLVLTRFRWVGYLFLALAIAADLLLLVGQVFVFVRLQDVFYLLKFAALASGLYQLLLVIGLLLVGFTFLVFVRIARTKQFGYSLVALNIGLLLYMTLVVYSGDEVQNRFWRVPVSALVSSPLVDVLDYRSRGFVETFELDGPAFSSMRYKDQTNDWLAVAPEQLNDRLLLIVNESWGVPLNARVQEAVLRPIISLKEVGASIQLGSMSFTGATVAGELRELCHLRPNHFNLANVTKGFEDCLPNRLRKAGYTTRAMHGAMGIMYDRVHWYPRAGFDHLTFFESKAWPARCRSFPGACDLDLMEELKTEFSLPGKRFFYWLTLNSHSVYDARDIRVDVFDCAQYEIEPGSESCRNLKLQAQFFYGLSQVLRDPRMKGVEILVIGDHSPPIFNAGEKARYFESEKVSWVHFKIN